MNFLRSLKPFTRHSQKASLLVSLTILLLAPGQISLTDAAQIERDSQTAWTRRAPQPMQPLQRIDLGRA